MLSECDYELDGDVLYGHDVETLVLQTIQLDKAAKEMRKQHIKIMTRKKNKDKTLNKSKDKYSAALNSLQDALYKVNEIISETGRDERLHMLDSCEQCKENEQIIKKQLSEIENAKTLQEQKIQELQNEIDKLSQEKKKEKELKRYVLRRSLDTPRPAKIAERLSELYDNGWTNAMEKMEKQGYDERQAVDELLSMLKQVYDKCLRLAADDFVERIERNILYPQEEIEMTSDNVDLPDQLKQEIKEFIKYGGVHIMKAVTLVVLPHILTKDRNEPEIVYYLKECVEICWLAVVQHPPLFLSVSPSETFDNDMYREYTQRGQYVEFVVWPALYLHKGGPLLAKGVAQGSKTRAVLVRTDKRHMLCADNPDVDLSDINRPKKIAEKLSELYDSAWTDAIEEMKNHGCIERKAIDELLAMIMEVYQKCLELANDGYFERVQRSILYPQTGCEKVIPGNLKQQIKEFRRYTAIHDMKTVVEVEMSSQRRI